MKYSRGFVKWPKLELNITNQLPQVCVNISFTYTRLRDYFGQNRILLARILTPATLLSNEVCRASSVQFSPKLATPMAEVRTNPNYYRVTRSQIYKSEANSSVCIWLISYYDRHLLFQRIVNPYLPSHKSFFPYQMELPGPGCHG